MEAGPCSFQMFEIVVHFFSMFFEDPFCTKCNLREFVLTHAILAPGARGRGVRAAARGVISAESAESGESGKLFQTVQIMFDFTAKVARVTLRCICLFFHTTLV